jgi:hypothetical protein
MCLKCVCQSFDSEVHSIKNINDIFVAVFVLFLYKIVGFSMKFTMYFDPIHAITFLCFLSHSLIPSPPFRFLCFCFFVYIYRSSFHIRKKTYKYLTFSVWFILLNMVISISIHFLENDVLNATYIPSSI